MKGTKKIEAVLDGRYEYIIPPYQRDYQWDAPRWQSVVSDVVQVATSPDEKATHWLGVLLLSGDSEGHGPGEAPVKQYTVIDGQQRLVTLAVWLAALVDHATDVGETPPLKVHDLASITVQATDQVQFRVAIGNQWRLPRYAPLLALNKGPLAAYMYFRWVLWLGEGALLEEEPIKMPRFKEPAANQRIEELWAAYLKTRRGRGAPRGGTVNVEDLVAKTRSRLTVISLIHDPSVDESQAAIFDTLNGMRTELEPLDHVRNSLFVRITPDAVARELYEKYWKLPEKYLRAANPKRMGAGKLFLYDYLIARGEKANQETLNANRGAAHFSYMTRDLKGTALRAFMLEDFLPAMASWPFVVGRSDVVHYDDLIRSFSARVINLRSSIRDLSEGPANPIVLHYVCARVLGEIHEPELERALRLTEAFIARYLLAGKPLSPLRSKVMEIMGSVRRDTNCDVLLRALQASGVPTDAEIQKHAEKAPYYERLKSRPLGALLRGIERQLSGDGAMVFSLGKGPDDYTIEHIYPQEPDDWKSDLQKWGADAQKMAKLMHTLGNLTAATNRHNNELRNRPLAEKQRIPLVPGKAAPLWLNRRWLGQNKWTHVQIKERTGYLVESALKQWRLD